VTGDVMVNMRSQQPIGALLSAVKDEEETYDEIYESWIHDRHVRVRSRRVSSQLMGILRSHA
jgi:hypothetical protein